MLEASIKIFFGCFLFYKKPSLYFLDPMSERIEYSKKKLSFENAVFNCCPIFFFFFKLQKKKKKKKIWNKKNFEKKNN